MDGIDIRPGQPEAEAERVMAGFPPPAAYQVTTENWRGGPYNRWAFCNMRQLFPTAGMLPAAQPSKLPMAPRGLGLLEVPDRNGVAVTLDQALASTQTDGFLVLHRGVVAMEWYGGHLRPRGQHTIQSISKSVAGLLAGVLVQRQLLDPDAPVTDYVPELGESGFARARVQHLLDMTTALDFDEDLADPDGDPIRFRAATTGTPKRSDVEVVGLRRALCSLRGTGGAHGEVFKYITPNTDALGWILERAAKAPYVDLLQDLLWEPLGMEGAGTLLLDVMGAPRAGGGISMTLRDLGRIGEMLRCRGAFGGRQVVPGHWVDDIRENGSEEAWSRGNKASVMHAHYRNFIYAIGGRTTGVLAGIGSYGQWLHVDARNDAVIVRLASEPVGVSAESSRYWRGLFAIIGKHLQAA